MVKLLPKRRLRNEQGADIVRIGEYVRHWLKWVRSGVVFQVGHFEVREGGGQYDLPHPPKNVIILELDT